MQSESQFRKLFEQMLNVIANNRAFSILALAYLSFFFRVYEDYSKQGAVQIKHSTGLELLDPTPEPVNQTRSYNLPDQKWRRAAKPGEVASGSAKFGSAFGSRRKRAMLTRQNIGEEEALEKAVRMLDHGDVLEQALLFSAEVEGEVQRNTHLVGIYLGLSQAYSAEGMYRRSLHAFDLAFEAAKKAFVGKEGRAHLLLGKTELKHHRYEKAATKLLETSKKYFPQLDKDEALAMRGVGAWSLLLTKKPGDALVQSAAAFEGLLGAGGGDRLLLWARGLTEGKVENLESCPILFSSDQESGTGLKGPFDAEAASFALVSAFLAGQRFAPSHPLERNLEDATPPERAEALRELELCVTELQALGSVLSDQDASLSPWALDTLGYAELALGSPEKAVTHHREALRLRSPPMLQQEGLTLDSSGLSQTLLLLGLAEYSAGKTEAGAGRVDKLLELSILAQRVPVGSDAETESESEAEDQQEVPLKPEKNITRMPQPPLSGEVVSWLVSFAKTQSMPSQRPRVQDFGAHLFERAFEVLNATEPFTPATTVLMVRHLQDYAKFLFRLSPPRFAEAIHVTERALALQTNREGQDEALAFNMLGACHQGLGNTQEAILFFTKAKDSFESRIKQGAKKPAQVLDLLASYANVAATKFQAASLGKTRLDQNLVKGAIADLRQALNLGKSFRLPSSNLRMLSLQASLRNVLRIAHYRGALGTCHSQKLDFVFGATCNGEE